MTNRELLELAAKAAGIKKTSWIEKSHEWFQSEGIGFDDENDCQQLWNPLTDDGDALRLAVKLQIDVMQYGDHVVAWFEGGYIGTGRILYDGDPYAATRRAIVRAAAEIGKALP